VTTSISGRRAMVAWGAALVVVAALPLLDAWLPPAARLASRVTPIFVFAIIGLGLTVVSGFTGLLNLGAAAFMALGAYAFSILTCPIYPFQVGFWPGLAAATAVGAAAGAVIALPAMRLRGDYLAIVTLGFGEIIQDVLRNLDPITKGTQGLNPVAPASLAGAALPPVGRYYLFLVLMLGAVWVCASLRRSRTGRAWEAVREDELAAGCMGVATAKTKLGAFALGAALCGLGGGLYASWSGSSIEPAFYDFQRSVIVLCIVIIGGLGSVGGALIGAAIMTGFNTILLDALTRAVGDRGGTAVWASPSNWKFLIYGLALVLMMRYRPDGLLPTRPSASARLETRR
jgi:branched-chain amino acid transport system permease protein